MFKKYGKKAYPKKGRRFTKKYNSYKKTPFYKAPSASRYTEFSLTSSIQMSAYNLIFNPMIISTRSPVVGYNDTWNDALGTN